MRIVEDTKNKLILREDRAVGAIIISFICFILGGITIPLLTLFTISLFYQQKLNCQRIQANRVDCQYNKILFFIINLTEIKMPFVKRVEYNYYDVDFTDEEGEERCNRKHKLIMIFLGNRREELFTKSTGCRSNYYENWMRDQVIKIKHFIAASKKEANIENIEIVRSFLNDVNEFNESVVGDENNVFNLIILIIGYIITLICMIIIISVLYYFHLFLLKGFLLPFTEPWRISLHFDKLSKELVYWETTMWQIKRLSYPFREISIRVNIKEKREYDVEDQRYYYYYDYKSEIVLRGEKKIHLDSKNKIYENEINEINEMLKLPQKVADFVGVKLEIIDERKPS